MPLHTACGRDGPLLLNTPIKEVSASLDKKIPVLMEEYAIVGLSVVMIKDGKVRLSKSFGYADLSSGKKINKSTVYKAASLGKPVFAYIVVKLAQQGKIDLDKPIVLYGEKPIDSNDPRSNQITARMVLSHTTGLPNLGGKSINPEFHFNPGEGFKYSGHAYLYLQKMIENVTGQHLDELANEIVFAPLKMTRSSYKWREDYQGSISSSYNSGKERFPVKKEALVGYSAWSLYTTIGNYANFVTHIMKMSTEPDSVAAQLLIPAVDVADEVKWGLGWGIQHTKPHASFWHWGSMAGFRHYVVGYPKEKIAVIVMSNSSQAFKMLDDVMVEAIGGSYPSYDWF